MYTTHFEKRWGNGVHFLSNASGPFIRVFPNTSFAFLDIVRLETVGYFLAYI